MRRVFGCVTAIIIAAGCAKADQGDDGDGGSEGDGGSGGDGPSCGADTCDQDRDGVVDTNDQCPNTLPNTPVNQVGCADSQVGPMLEDTFPPYGLTWTPTGDLGRPGGLTWTYTGITRGDHFHIYWVVCDDPATRCGLALDGTIDPPDEYWLFSAAQSSLVGGRLVYTNTTQIALADSTNRPLIGRLTLTIVDGSDAPIPCTSVSTLGVPARAATHGAELTSTGFKVTVLAEVQDTITSTWTPYLDYFDAAPTPMTGGGATVSFGGSFYDE